MDLHRHNSEDNLSRLSTLRLVLLVISSFIGTSACIEDPPRPTSELDVELEQPDSISPNQVDMTPLSSDQNILQTDMGRADLDSHIIDMEQNNGEMVDSFTGGESWGGEVIDSWNSLDLPLPDISDEVCDGVDNDFDALIDEGLANPCGGCMPFDEEYGCVAWRVNLVETQTQDDQGSISAGVLDPQRLIGQSAAITQYKSFEIPGAQCTRYGSPQVWEGAESFGAVNISSPLVNLNVLPNLQQPGRYRLIGEDQSPLLIHRPQDNVNVEWAGNHLLIPPIESHNVSLTSPAFVEMASVNELERLIDAIHRGPDDEAESDLPIRWIAEPIGEVAGPPLQLYVGGSQSLYRSGAQQGIQHYQLNAELFDDGLFDVVIPDELRVPNSSVWVYLERRQQYTQLDGQHPIRINLGHRAEARRSGAGQSQVTPLLTIIRPNPQSPEPDVSNEGLNMQWSLAEDGRSAETVFVSLILYDNSWSESLTCLLNNPRQTNLLIPAERLTFWPMHPQSVRQVTITAGLKSLQIDYPDRGTWRLSESAILRLSDL